MSTSSATSNPQPNLLKRILCCARCCWDEAFSPHSRSASNKMIMPGGGSRLPAYHPLHSPAQGATQLEPPSMAEEESKHGLTQPQQQQQQQQQPASAPIEMRAPDSGWYSVGDRFKVLLPGQDSTEEFRVGGVQGVEHPGWNVVTGEAVAIKRQRKESSESARMQLLRGEIRVMEHMDRLVRSGSLRPGCVVRLREVHEDESQVCLVLEMLRGGTLQERLDEEPTGRLNEPDASDIVRWLAALLRDLHSNGIVHADLSMNSLLFRTASESMDRGGAGGFEHASASSYASSISPQDLVLADFGISSDGLAPLQGGPVTDDHSAAAHAMMHMSPEMLRAHLGVVEIGRSWRSPAGDMWGLGCILHYLLSGRGPFAEVDLDNKASTASIVQQFLAAVKDDAHLASVGVGDAWEGVSAPACDLVKSLLVVNPDDRATADEVLQHVWVAHWNDCLPVDDDVSDRLIAPARGANTSPMAAAGAMAGGGAAGEPAQDQSVGGNRPADDAAPIRREEAKQSAVSKAPATLSPPVPTAPAGGQSSSGGGGGGRRPQPGAVAAAQEVATDVREASSATAVSAESSAATAGRSGASRSARSSRKVKARDFTSLTASAAASDESPQQKSFVPPERTRGHGDSVTLSHRPQELSMAQAAAAAPVKIMSPSEELLKGSQFVYEATHLPAPSSSGESMTPSSEQSGFDHTPRFGAAGGGVATVTAVAKGGSDAAMSRGGIRLAPESPATVSEPRVRWEDAGSSPGGGSTTQNTPIVRPPHVPASIDSEGTSDSQSVRSAAGRSYASSMASDTSGQGGYFLF